METTYALWLSWTSMALAKGHTTTTPRRIQEPETTPASRAGFEAARPRRRGGVRGRAPWILVNPCGFRGLQVATPERSNGQGDIHILLEVQGHGVEIEGRR